MSNNIIDSIFTTNLTSIDINVDFIYNEYDENELSIDDKKIINSNSYFKRYIEISSNKSINFINTDEQDRLRSQSELSIKEILFRLNNKNLNENENFYFNRLYNYDVNKIFFQNKTLNDKRKIKKFYNISDSEEDNLLFLTNNSKFAINKKNSSFISSQEENHEFSSGNEIFVLNNYENIYKNSMKTGINLLENIKKGNVLSNFKPFRHTDAFYTDENSNFITNCGFLIEKYKLENDNYEHLTSYFVHKNSTERNNDSFDLNIKDINIKYGVKYLYTVSLVYIYRIVNNLFEDIIDYYLITGYPSISEVINCVEKEPPPPPINISGEYNHKINKFTLRWEEPSNYQNDIAGYQILKRRDLDSPYTVVKELLYNIKDRSFVDNETVLESVKENRSGIIENKFVDIEYNPNIIEIYCIRSIDVHGNKSLYSKQVGFIYLHLEDELILDVISDENSPIEYPNLKIPRRTRFYENEENIITNTPVYQNKNTVNLFFTPDYVNLSDDDLETNICKSEYQFTLFNMNTQEKYVENIKIKNINIF